MGGMEATLLLGSCRGHGHGKKWSSEWQTGHMLRCGKWGLGGAKRRNRGHGDMRGQWEGGTVR